jgi:hypothetical protein
VAPALFSICVAICKQSVPMTGRCVNGSVSQVIDHTGSGGRLRASVEGILLTLSLSSMLGEETLCLSATKDETNCGYAGNACVVVTRRWKKMNAFEDKITDSISIRGPKQSQTNSENICNEDNMLRDTVTYIV